MINFYTDAPSKFECMIKIENISTKNAKARLVITPENYPHAIMIESLLNGDTNCKISVPALGFLEPNSKATCKLEVLVDNYYFDVYNSACKITKLHNVKVSVNENTIVEDNKPKVSAVVVEKEKTKSFLKEDVSDVDLQFVNKMVVEYTNLSKEKKERIDSIISKKKFSKSLTEWRDKIFEDSENNVAKYVIFRLNELKKKKKHLKF